MALWLGRSFLANTSDRHNINFEKIVRWQTSKHRKCVSTTCKEFIYIVDVNGNRKFRRSFRKLNVLWFVLIFSCLLLEMSSLFPAYANVQPSTSTAQTFPSFPSAVSSSAEPSTSEQSTDLSWLKNTSFKSAPIPVVDVPDESSSSNNSGSVEFISEKVPKKKRRKEKKKRRKEKKEEVLTKPVKSTKPTKQEFSFAKDEPVECLVGLDTWRDVENFQFDSMYKRRVPNFDRKGLGCYGASERVNRVVFKDEWPKTKVLRLVCTEFLK